LLDHGEFPYGLGASVQSTSLGPMYGHTGYFPGYSTVMEYFPNHKIAVAAQFNRDYGHGDLKEDITALAGVVIDGFSGKHR